MRQMVPFVATLGCSFDEAAPGHAVVRLPDRTELHNHLGGPHAGVLFALGETAAGAAFLAAYADLLDRAVPVAAGANIRYRRIAMGDVTATASFDVDRAEMVRQLDAGTVARCTVAVTIRDHAGEPTSEMEVEWALRPHRPGASD